MCSPFKNLSCLHVCALILIHNMWNGPVQVFSFCMDICNLKTSSLTWFIHIQKHVSVGSSYAAECLHGRYLMCSFGNTIGECSRSLHLMMSELRHWAIIKNNGQVQHYQVPSIQVPSTFM